jgi:GDP-L-fucose synthase
MIDPFPISDRESDELHYFDGRRVAVTGASGLIGSYAVKILKEVGAHVVSIVHDRPANEFTRLADEVKWANLMDGQEASLRHVFAGCSDVVSCAGITGGVNLPKKDPVSYVGPATVIAMNTLHASYMAGVRRIGWLSSTTVYPPMVRPAVESDVTSTVALYPLYRGIGESKRFLEKLFAYYHETVGIGAAVVRPAGAYGRFDNFDESTSHVLPAMVMRALKLGEHEQFEVWGDGDDVRDFIHAQDVARCLLYAMAKRPVPDPVNVASGYGVKTIGLARIVLAAAGMGGTVIRTSTDKPSALRVRLVDTTKAQEELGFVPHISLVDGVRDVVEWRRSR